MNLSILKCYDGRLGRNLICQILFLLMTFRSAILFCMKPLLIRIIYNGDIIFRLPLWHDHM